MPEVTPKPELVRWLFLDLNSYFASVEQELRPELRGKPVAVVPVMAETTCCIAASYEAKAFGVRTGTGVKEAKLLCPELQVVEGRQNLYVDYHRRIVEAIELYIPIERPARSIDEVACKLMGSKRQIKNAIALAEQVKQSIRENVGSTLRCSIGLAPNEFLAKVAADMHKPDGLTVLPPSQIPKMLFSLKPQDLPGIGYSMNRRLERKGIFTVEQLWKLGPAGMRDLWGSVLGERFWHCMRGENIERERAEYQKSVGHQHVLPPEMRNHEQACAVLQRLLHKAAVRLRRLGMWAGGLSLYVSFSYRRERKIWECHTRILECQDTITLLETFHKLWRDCPVGKPTLVGVCLYDLVPHHLHTPSIFAEENKRARLAKIVDEINAKYGIHHVYLGGIHHVLDSAPTRIAFSSIPEFED